MRYLSSNDFEVGSAVVCQTRYPSYLRLVSQPCGSTTDTYSSMGNLASKHRDRSMHSFIAGMVCSICIVALFVTVVYICDSIAASKRAEVAGSVSYVEIIVSKGDSLWDIASEHSIQGLATADTVELIEEHNTLDGALLVAGQRLWVPLS